jgi:hypothetical protein
LLHSGARVPGTLRVLAVAACLALSAASGAAFADNGHRVIGQLAEMHLRGSRAMQEVRRILRQRETLAEAAVWPDTIKDVRYEDEDTSLFRLEHPAHDVYHYTNLPFQVDRYDPSVPGARSGDLLQITKECIRVLRGTSQSFTPREALRLLAHLVGDMHQPLHVGNGYLPAAGPLQFVVPRGPTGWRPTLGGNALVYGPQDRFNLHSYWDAHAVNLTMGREDVPTFASRLFAEVPATPDWSGSGAVDQWPEHWVNESLGHSREAYRDIVVTSYLGPDDGGRTAHRWRIEQPPGYDDAARKRVRQQLARAGYRLAATLKAIWP